MSPRVPDPACEPVLEELEALVDGELGRRRSRELRLHLDGCAACRAELELARRVRAELRALPEHDTPPATLARVLAAARAEGAEADRSAEGDGSRPGAARAVRRWTPRWMPPRLHPALAGLAAAAALVVGVLIWRAQSPPPAPPAPEVARATLEVKLALARVSEVNRELGLEVGREVLRRRIAVPATRGLVRGLPLETGAGSREPWSAGESRPPNGAAPKGAAA